MRETLWRILDFVGDAVLMQVLWIVSSLPVFTIGASTTALYYTAMKRVHQDRGTVFSNFKHSFKQNFKQSTIYWLALVASGVVLAFDLTYVSNPQNLAGKAMFTVYIFMLVVWWMLCLYIFPVQAKFESTLVGNVKNALFLAIRHLPFTLLLTVIWLVPSILAVVFPPFTGLLITCGVGLLSCLASLIFVHIFLIYTHEDDQPDDTSSPLPPQ